MQQEDLEQIKQIFEMTAKDKLISFNAGVEEGRQHSTMSPETANHLGMIKDDINQIKVSITNLKVSITKLPQEIYDKCDKKFASKLVERVVYTLLAISFFGAISFFIKTATNAFF